ncbi:MAG: DUF3159 domain-containing protein [Halanaerobiales bacterium]
MSKLRELLDQLKLVIKGKTIDALAPAIIFTIINGIFGLFYAVITALITASLILVIRIINKSNIKYSLAGLLIVIIAAGLAYFSGNAANYYLPSILNNLFIFIVAIVSILIKKPIAALTSHLSRGWDFDWYLRKDILPAYIEVSIIWAGFFLIRAFIQMRLYIGGNVEGLGFINILLSLPFTIIILLISYIYGLWRLRNLGGPSIEEHKDDKPPPWEGQKLGF